MARSDRFSVDGNKFSATASDVNGSTWIRVQEVDSSEHEEARYCCDIMLTGDESLVWHSENMTEIEGSSRLADAILKKVEARLPKILGRANPNKPTGNRYNSVADMVDAMIPESGIGSELRFRDAERRYRSAVSDMLFAAETGRGPV